ncbi:MAG: hypothetical protein IT460_00200 [Planctomycetes bacterium]|nr:hypothetical protein [Planctomycetota bacterium]
MALSRCGWCGVALRPASRAAHVRAAGCHDCGHSTIVGDDGVAVAFPRTAPRVQQVGHRVRFSRRLRGGGVAGGGRRGGIVRASQRVVEVAIAAVVLVSPLAFAWLLLHGLSMGYGYALALLLPPWWVFVSERLLRRADWVFVPGGVRARGGRGPTLAVRAIRIDRDAAAGTWGWRRLRCVHEVGREVVVARFRYGDVAADALASVLRAAVEGPGAVPAPTPAGAVMA